MVKYVFVPQVSVKFRISLFETFEI